MPARSSRSAPHFKLRPERASPWLRRPIPALRPANSDVMLSRRVSLRPVAPLRVPGVHIGFTLNQLEHITVTALLWCDSEPHGKRRNDASSQWARSCIIDRSAPPPRASLHGRETGPVYAPLQAARVSLTHTVRVQTAGARGTTRRSRAPRASRKRSRASPSRRAHVCMLSAAVRCACALARAS